MEDTNADKKTQEILAFRKLVLTNPDFNTRMMQAIAQEKFVRQQRQILTFWLLVVGTLEVVVALLLWLFQVTLSDIANLPFYLIDQVSEAIHWIIEQQYVFIPLAVVLLLKVILDSRTRYS
ncbi:MAG: hypothetical protein M3Q05_13980 [Bacteroidota bacterium]|nr:hypothetical protein [Bacteroidota bacterium]